MDGQTDGTLDEWTDCLERLWMDKRTDEAIGVLIDR